MDKKIVLYPGTFDPPTLGHLDVIRKSADLFDEVIVGVLTNIDKSPMFSRETRLEMLRAMIKAQKLSNVRTDYSDELTVEAARSLEAIAIIRGMRLTTEYEAELSTSFTNDILSHRTMITVLVPPDQRYMHIHSRIVRELIRFKNKEELREILGSYLSPEVIQIALGE